MKKILYIIILLVTSKFCAATHIVGGGIDVQWISGNKYKISLRVLRDCLNGSPETAFPKESKPVVAIYTKSTNQIATSVTLNLIYVKKLDFFAKECSGTVNECVEEGLFSADIDLIGLENNNGYYVVWERCCRNDIISNIIEPGKASMAFYSEIPKNSLQNSTPKYTKNPVTLICVGDTFKYNFGFTDTDLDSISYSLVNPLNGFLDENRPRNDGIFSIPGPYPEVQWGNSFSANNAIKGNPPLTINKLNGDITVKANQVGVYVAAIKVEEFRNGVKIGEVRLELQFNAVICPPNIEPTIVYSDTVSINNQVSFFEVEIPNQICFDIHAGDLSLKNDSLYMTVSSPHFNSTYVSQPSVNKSVAGFKEIRNRFCWKTTCELSKVGTVLFKVNVADNGCPYPKKTQSDIFVRIKPMRVIDPPIFECLGLLNGKTQLNWTDTNTSTLLKSFRIYRGINDTGYKLIAEVGKLLTQYVDQNTPNNKTINYTYKIASVNLCDSQGTLTPPKGTIETLPQIYQTSDLNEEIGDTIVFEANISGCFKIKSKDLGDSLSMKISSIAFDSLYGNTISIQKLKYGNDSVESTFCWKPNCEAVLLRHIPIDIETDDYKCPIKNKVTKRIWLKITSAKLIASTDMLCMTLSNDNITYVYYGDTSDIYQFKYFLVYRGIDFKNYSVIDTIWNKGPRYFIDRNSPNNKKINYCYFMIGVNKCRDIGIPSDTISTFEQIEYIPKKQVFNTVTVEDNANILINWYPSQENDFAKYFLYKSTDLGKNFSLIDTLENVKDTFYLDKNVNVNRQSYCYHLVMFDTCDNIGPKGKVACSILLNGESRPALHNFDWNEYIGWDSEPNNYEIMRRYVESKDYSQAKVSALNNNFDNVFDKDEGAYFYYVVANKNNFESSSDKVQSKSNEIYLYQKPNVFMPNAITNNYDGLNDELEIMYSFVKSFSIKIYNRWGEMVFESKNKKDKWNAKSNDVAAPTDVYFYFIDYQGFDGISRNKKGTITILR